MASVSLQGVYKSFGDVEVVRGVDLEIADGEFLVLVGASGCGKSTLLRMLAGLEEPSSGTIAIGGQRMNGVKPRDRDIAMVFQSYALYPHMSVRENMAFGLKVRGLEPSAIDQAVEDAARLLDIEHLLDRLPKQMSGGQRQRVAMGRALVRRPKVFLFDEPLSNLDAALRTQMRVELKRLHQQLGVTTVYVTHDQVEAMTLADRIALMNRGVVEQVGAPRTLYDWPASRYVASFLGSPGMNFVTGTLKNCMFEAPGCRLPVAEHILWDKRASGAVVAGVRPHAVHLVRGDDQHGKVDATVEVLEPMGWETHAHLRVGGEPWIARFDAAEAAGLRPGDAVAVYIEPADVRLFDGESGKALTHRLGDKERWGVAASDQP